MKETKELSKSEKLKKELFINRDNPLISMSDSKLAKIDKFSEGYKTFLDNSKTEREAVKNILSIAVAAGFKEFSENTEYSPGDRVYYLNKEKSLILSVIGKKKTSDGVLMAISHIDSPRLDLKPNPLYESKELAYFKTRYYGGIRKYQWLAIPLSLHGRVVKKDGTFVDINIGEKDNEPCFCVTDLLPHLAKEQSEKTIQKAFVGENLNILVGSRPFKDDKGSELVKLNIMKIINDKYGIIESDFMSAELELVPSFKASDVGFDRSLVGSYGQDDRVCAYPSLEAILNCGEPNKTVMAVFCDKEETGSDGNTGMKSQFLRYFISEMALMEGEKTSRVISKSKCLSADVSPAFDPTYSDVYDERNSSFLNHGVVIAKYTGSGGKSGTSDASAEFVGEIRKLLDDSDVLWQMGELGKVDAGGGGTIAKFIANLNVDVVDMGVSLLSMHAPFEIVSKSDVYMLFKAIKCFFAM